MANGQWSTGVAAVTGTATTVHSAVMVEGGANQGLEIIGFSFSTDGAQAGLYLVEICLSDGTSVGTWTNSPSAIGIGDTRLTTNVATVGTVKNTASAEPTVLSVVDAFYIPAGAPFAYRWPLSERLYVGPSSHLGCLRVTPPGSTSSVYRCAMYYED